MPAKARSKWGGLTPADFIIGVHPGCGGLVELVEYASICMACHAQDWDEDSRRPYVEDLLEQTVPLRELSERDTGDEHP